MIRNGMMEEMMNLGGRHSMISDGRSDSLLPFDWYEVDSGSRTASRAKRKRVMSGKGRFWGGGGYGQCGVGLYWSLIIMQGTSQSKASYQFHLLFFFL